MAVVINDQTIVGQIHFRSRTGDHELLNNADGVGGRLGAELERSARHIHGISIQRRHLRHAGAGLGDLLQCRGDRPGEVQHAVRLGDVQCCVLIQHQRRGDGMTAAQDVDRCIRADEHVQRDR